jgi:para-nitrobenzyl esterase
MRQYFGGLAICLLLTALSGSGQIPDPQSSAAPLVTLETGSLEGIHFGSAQGDAAFLGVPYAEPPVGELRWRAPRPIGRWKGTRAAKRFGAACPQLPARWLPSVGWDEDCLYLNVWTAQFSPRGKLPVIVYFHGGSNTAGYSQMTPLGPALSPLGVVVVSANYRLGPLGFLAHPALTAESEHHSSGNYGLLDQLQALRWVRENISRFGGDPDRVTVMGQSAGAVDICLLMASPMAAGLFERAILESGDCQGVFNEDIRTPIRYNLISDSGEASGESMAKDLGVANGPEALQRLRRVPVDEILKAWSGDKQVHFDAIVDGWVVPEQPARIFAEGREVRVPVLVGSNADEATVFGHNDVETVKQFKDYLFRDTGAYSEQELLIYPATSDSEVPGRYLQLQNDSFAYGADSMAKAMTRVGQKAYLYCFGYVESGKRQALGAYHGEELLFLSDSYPSDWEHGADDERLGEIMRAYWAQFAKTGSPNAAGLPAWPVYDARSDECLELGRAIGVRHVAAQVPALEGIMKRIVWESPGGGASQKSRRISTPQQAP